MSCSSDVYKRQEQTVSFAFTEPETGSDPKMLKTRLEKQADGTYKLNGVKRFISNAGYDGPCVLFALQKDEESGKDLVTGLVIDKFCEGYSISVSYTHLVRPRFRQNSSSNISRRRALVRASQEAGK